MPTSDRPPGPGLPVTAVLWDIDGTLLTTGGVSTQVFLDSVSDVVGRRPDGRGLDFGGRIDPEIAALLLGSLGADESLIPQVIGRLQVNANSRVEEFRQHVRPLPGVVQTLSLLAQAGVRQTVVTGNIRTVGRIKLEAANLVPPIDPDLGGFGDSGATRVEVALAALELLVGANWERSLDQCWIVGDTPRDLLCANALGVRCALVGTGTHSAGSMSGLGADLVLTGLDDAAKLYELWALT